MKGKKGRLFLKLECQLLSVGLMDLHSNNSLKTHQWVIKTSQ